MAPVVGKVTSDGEPAKHGFVIFYPNEAKGNGRMKVAMAVIQSDGTYKMLTYDQAGVPLGWYKVVVMAAKEPIPPRYPRTPPGEKPWEPDWIIDRSYTRVYLTPLEIEVVMHPAPGAYDLT